MLGLLGMVALAAVGYLSAAVARERGRPTHFVAATGLRVGAGIAIVRIGVLYVSPLMWGSQARPPLGALSLLLSLLNCGFETVAARALLATRANLRPSLLLATLVSLTSIPLGFAWTWIRSRPRSGVST